MKQILLIALAASSLSASAIVDENGRVITSRPCEEKLTTIADVAGYFASSVTIGDVIFFNKRACVVENISKEGGGYGHGPGDYYPPVPTVHIRKLNDDMTYNPNAKIRKISLKTNYSHGVAEFFVIGKMELGIAPNQKWDPNKQPQLVALSTKIYEAEGRTKAIKIGSVVLIRDSEKHFVVVSNEGGVVTVSELDSQNAYRESAPTQQLETAPLVELGFVRQLTDGRRAAMHANWKRVKEVAGMAY